MKGAGERRWWGAGCVSGACRTACVREARGGWRLRLALVCPRRRRKFTFTDTAMPLRALCAHHYRRRLFCAVDQQCAHHGAALGLCGNGDGGGGQGRAESGTARAYCSSGSSSSRACCCHGERQRKRWWACVLPEDANPQKNDPIAHGVVALGQQCGCSPALALQRPSHQ